MQRRQGSKMLKRVYPDTSDAIDITRPLDMDTPVFPGDPKINLEKMMTGSSTITKIKMCSHSGTHLDAPSHYIKNGEGIESVSLHLINGLVKVIDLTGKEGEIQPCNLNIRNEKRVLIRTGYSLIKGFDPCYSALSIESAEYIVNSGIECIGIDSPSIEIYEGDGSVHRMLLSANIAVIELLDLSRAEEGMYIMNALPMPLKKCDGAPLRALLYKVDEGELCQ